MIFNIRRRTTKINPRQRRTVQNVTTKSVVRTGHNITTKTTHKSRTNKTHVGDPMLNTMKMKSNKKGGGCSCGK